ncbi:MAG: tRNA preQ1(34) S-adenosylmethionine ribosyltransferase-isomerase QueA [Bacillota bacterium]
MRPEEFDYRLPPELIAQEPIEPRDASRLLVLDRRAEAPGHYRFRDLPRFLRAGDLLVFNDTRVVPARLHARRCDTGGRAEVLLLRPLSPEEGGRQAWEVLGRPARRLRAGMHLACEKGGLEVVVTAVLPEGLRQVELVWDAGESLVRVLEQAGEIPLPPYIHRPLADGERYQTVYAHRPGSAAAPTAGLHFTPGLLEDLRAGGVEMCYLTLHVGLGTFRPIRTETVEEASLHAEYYRVEGRAAAAVNVARRRGSRVVAVGTTVVRTLETAATPAGEVRPGEGWTDLFIYPGYRFRVVDALVTNFHLPRSSLLMLVCALAGTDRVLAAYREAVNQRYRFYSFGDAMLIV